MSNLNRRQFLTRSTAAGLALGASTLGARRVSGDSANETIVVGVMGASRGLSLAGGFEKQPNCVVKYICDVDAGRAKQGAVAIERIKQRKPEAITDYQKILNDKDVDVLVCAAPNHWHAPATIWACRAGKHVYVEKPCSHNPAEGELMVAEARKT